MRGFRLLVLLLAACSPAIGSAAFDETDVLQFRASARLSHDDNLFRLPDGFELPNSQRSDTVRTAGIGLRLNKPVSRQRFVFDGNLYDNDYRNNSNLDHVSGDAQLSWLWQIGNRWSGDLRYQRRRSLAGFGDFLSNVKDLLDSESYTLSAGYEFHPRWRVYGEFLDSDVEHSERTTLDQKRQTAGGGITYTTPAANQVALRYRRTEGDFPNRPSGLRLDNEYTETRITGTVDYRLSGAILLDGRLGHVERSNPSVAVRDFSGVTWYAGAIWEPTGKVRVTAYGSRDIRVYDDSRTSYVLVRTWSVSPLWSVTSKIAVQADLTHETRRYLGDPTGLGLETREDKLKLARLALIYSPYRYLTFSLSFEAGDRNSNEALRDFEYQSWLGTVQFSF